MELPWSGVDCNTVTEPRGGCCTPATWGCATSETLRSESGWPAPRETGLCFTFALVSALCRETRGQGCLGEGNEACRALCWGKLRAYEPPVVYGKDSDHEVCR